MRITNKNTEQRYVVHKLKPIYDKNSKILILGSFPSVKSREYEFYYGHPQNRFWKVINYVCTHSSNEKKKVTLQDSSNIKEKTKLLQTNNIALWDVIHSCTITGSSDSSIKDVTPVAIETIFATAKIKAVFTNGGLATKLYIKYLEPITNIKPIQLPSTSPANARYSLENLQNAWNKKINKIL